MTDFLQSLKYGAKQCGLEGATILLGISGGADSVAMLRGLADLKQQLQLTLVVVHLNHKLRGEDSNHDVQWVKTLCSTLGLPVVIESQDVQELSRVKGLGIEETARKARYEFFEQTAEQHECTHICTAHTANDQVETILHHILRGTGISGLRGMPQVRQLSSGRQLARPMLEVTRKQVEAYLNEIGQEFRTDASNLDHSFTRNRIRGDLLPLLEQNYNPQVRDAFLRLGKQAAEIEETLEILTVQLLGQAIEDQTADIVRLNCDVLVQQPRHLVRECFVRLWRDLHWPRQQMGFDEWERLAELVQGEGTVTLPGNIEARRRGNLFVLRKLGE